MRAQLADGVDIDVADDGLWMSVAIIWPTKTMTFLFGRKASPTVMADQIMSATSGKNIGTHANLVGAIKQLSFALDKLSKP